ncbi:MAG: CsbD family protein [Gammaproteobacteria bacterium]|nr:CsbD family protein [Gammaproteobacteria bacterium]
MNKDIISGYWHEVKGKLKQQWAKLTDDDITAMKGSYEELSGYLQKNYGYEKDQAKKEIDSFTKKHGWLI